MRPASEVVVTLTPSLWSELRRQAAALDVPIEWLIAGLVCDTVEAPGVRDGSGPSPCPAADRSPAARPWHSGLGRPRQGRMSATGISPTSTPLTITDST